MFKADSAIHVFGNLADVSQTSIFIVANKISGACVSPNNAVLVIERTGDSSQVLFYDYNGDCLLAVPGDPYVDEVNLFINECKGLFYQSLQRIP